MSSIIRQSTEEICAEIIKMIDMVITNHELAHQVLKSGDSSEALKVLEHDNFIDAKSYEIESDLEFLITKAPVDIDLRRTLSYLHSVRELERIADYAKHIAKFIIKSKDNLATISLKRIDKVHSLFLDMLKDTHVLLENETLDNAMTTAQKDDLVDDMVAKIRTEVISSIANQKETKLIEQNIFCLNVVNALERASDHIVNLCELIAYIPTGNRNGFN